MGRPEEPRDRPYIGYLVVLTRVPVGVAGTAAVLLVFAAWLVLESAVAVAAFPLAAVFANQAWIRGSWLGRYPVSLREFARDGFGYFRVVWGWVVDPMEAVDLNVEVGGGPAPPVPASPHVPAPVERPPVPAAEAPTAPAAGATEPPVPPEPEPEAETAEDSNVTGCVGCVLIVVVGLVVAAAAGWLY